MIGYCRRLILEKESKLCKVIYDRLLYLFNDDHYKSKWLMTIKSILEERSMAEVWENHAFESINMLIGGGMVQLVSHLPLNLGTRVRILGA